MQIAKNTVVTLDYHVTDAQGNLVDEGREPLVYLHGGYGGIFDKIEETLHGKGRGEQLTMKLEPNEAFGEYDADLVAVEPRNLFPDNIEVGMQFERAGVDDDEVDDDEDESYGLFTITDIAEDKVVVDANHPLAGMALVFTCTVTDVRNASSEELSHGHAHTADTHHQHH